MGGLEHRSGSEVIGERLIEQAGGQNPLVAIVPVASSPKKRPEAVEMARHYWGGLGASVEIVLPGGAAARAGQVLDQASIIMLTGGIPDRIHVALSGTALWQRILGRWRQGALLAGSSAGAIELFEWRLKLSAPRPFSLIRGLGPMKNFITVPHYNAYGIHRWATRIGRRFSNVGLLGLDEKTSLIGRAGAFAVFGQGAVTVIKDGTRLVYPAGSELSLEIGSA
ncbi:MAG: Type 1 glutamine amidotransferase-like domain-containing protein [Actinomycetota bacterium]